VETPLARRLPVLLLAAAIAAALTYLLTVDAGLGFVSDDFEFLIGRPGWSPDVFLQPFHESTVVVPGLIYKLVLGAFGMGSAMPYFVVAMLLFGLAAVLLFAWLRRRVGDWLALLMVLPVLVLGAASEDIFWAFQMGYFGSVALGLGMLLALDRGDRRGDMVAAALLLGSLAFGSIGVAFAAAFLAHVLVGPEPRWPRLRVLAVPIGAYVLWWLFWGHDEGSQISVHNLVHLPGFVFNAAAAGMAALLGQEVSDRSNGTEAPLLFRALAAVAVLALAAQVWRRRELPRGLAVVVVLALAIWVLPGLNHGSGRYPTSSRYQYASAIFILLVAAEALRGFETRRLLLGAALVLSAIGVVGGIQLLEREGPGWERLGGESSAVLGAVDLGGAEIGPDYELPAGIEFTAGAYRAQAAAHGSPAFDEAQLLEGDNVYAERADSIQIGAMGVELRPLRGPDSAGCRPLRRDPVDGVRTLPPGRYLVRNDGNAEEVLSLARFARPPGATLGVAPPATSFELRLPRGASPRPWTLVASVGVEVCAA
jgi:hypothetical protein